MAKKSDYGQVASEIAKYLNSFGLAFKTYNISEFDSMIKAVAGDGARIDKNSESNATDFQNALLERGFTIFPEITEAEDGYVRVIRTNSIVNNLLNAFKYVGARGDEDLARLLSELKKYRREVDVSDVQIQGI